MPVFGPGVGFGSILCLNRDPSIAFDRNIQVAPRWLQGPLGEIHARPFNQCINPGWKTRAKNRHRPKLIQVRAKTDRIGISKIIAVGGLRQQSLFRAAHGDIEITVHKILALTTNEY